MKWTVAFHDEFEPEFDKFPAAVQDELFAEASFIEQFGPLTGRPHVDKLHGSDYANMKELRFEAMNDEWRVASRSILSRSRSYWLPAVRPEPAKRSFTRH